MYLKSVIARIEVVKSNNKPFLFDFSSDDSDDIKDIDDSLFRWVLSITRN